MKYTVALRKTDDGISIRCIELPGCWSQGATETEALENIKEAIDIWLDTKSELDKEITEGSTLCEVIVVR
jgi:predicted RNase H-like HicB family nuclease